MVRAPRPANGRQVCPPMKPRVHTHRRWLATLLLAGFSTWSLVGAAEELELQPDSPAQALARELQQRQLHRLAEIHCREQLERAEQSEEEVAPWVLGLLD